MQKNIFSNRFIVVLVILNLGLSLLQFDSIPVGSFFDDAHYIVLAESLASGQGYHLINFPDMPAESAFPPGWPILLTPIVGLFPHNYTLYKLFTLGFSLASLFLAYKLFASRLASPYLEILLTLITLNPHLIGASTTVMSEPAYLFFALLTLVLFDKWQKKQHSYWLLGLAVITAVFTLMIRTVGIALLGSVLVYVFWQNGRRLLLPIIIVTSLTLIPLIWLTHQNGGLLIFSPLYSQHINNVLSQTRAILQNWQYTPAVSPTIVANAIIPVFIFQRVSDLISPTLNTALSLSVIGVTLWGFFIALRRPQTMELYVAFYIAIFLMWSVYINEFQPRQLIPLIPFLYYYLVRLLAQSRLKPRLLWSGLSLVSILFIALNLYAWQHPPRDRIIDLSLGSDWIRENSEPQAIIMTAAPTPDYLYAQRQTVYYQPIDNLNAYLQTQQVSYILLHPKLNLWSEQPELDEFVQKELLPYLSAYPEQFAIVYANGEAMVTVYKVIE